MVKGLTLAALLALVACTTTRGTLCADHPIRLSKQAIAALSDAEVKAILSHNIYGQKTCGWAP